MQWANLPKRQRKLQSRQTHLTKKLNLRKLGDMREICDDPDFQQRSETRIKFSMQDWIYRYSIIEGGSFDFDFKQIKTPICELFHWNLITGTSFFSSNIWVFLSTLLRFNFVVSRFPFVPLNVSICINLFLKVVLAEITTKDQRNQERRELRNCHASQ